MPTTSLLSFHTTPPIPLEGGYVAQLRPFPCETSPAFEASWKDLERRSLHRNPFLSPSFLFPQTQCQLPKPEQQLLTIIDSDGKWLLAGVFDRVSGTRHLPLPHLRASVTEHTFMSGLLIDATECEAVVDTLWAFARMQGWHGISFPMFPVRSSLALLLTEKCERERLSVVVDDLHSRATVTPFDGSGMSTRRAKSLRRGRRILEKHGPVTLSYSTCSGSDLSVIERFLFLESLGWKGAHQSALACHLNQVQAMKDMAIGFAQQDRIRFAELAVDSRVIASMCLLRSESDYFAFKIGWDQQFERSCPGFLLGAEIQDSLHQLPACGRIDGCAKPNSFLDHVWPGRQEMGTALYTTTRWGSLAARGTQLARDIFRHCRGRSGKSIPPCIEHSVETEESL